MTLLKLVDTPDCSLNRVHGGSPSWSGWARLCRTLGTHFQRIYEKKVASGSAPLVEVQGEIGWQAGHQ